MIAFITPFACAGKAAYTTKGKALEILARRRKRAKARMYHKEKRREIAQLTAYRCVVCHQWHIGGHHDPKAPRS